MDRTSQSPSGAGSPSRPALSFALAAAFVAVSVAACTEGRGAQDPSQQQPYDPNNPYAQQGQPPPQGYGQQGQYPPPQGQQYPQQGSYPPQNQSPQGYGQQGPYPQQGAYPQQPGQYPPQGQPAATTAASPLALPCQNDLICGVHKCNLATQRCAFPCTANTDCAAGFACMGAGAPTAICIPGGGT